MLGLRGATSTGSEAPINEWGFYDPDLAGVGALISSIDPAEIPIPGGIEEDPSELLLRQKVGPSAEPVEVFRPQSPFDGEGAPHATAAAAVASCRVGHLAPLSLWARVTDDDSAGPQRATPDLLDRLLSQWLFAERSRRNRRYASSDLAVQIGELTHPAHVALTGLTPVCRIRGVRTAPLAAVSRISDDMPGWAEPAFTPVPDTIAVEYLQASDSDAERAAARTLREERDAEGSGAQETAPEEIPEAATSATLEALAEAAQELAPEGAPEPTPVVAFSEMPEPAFESEVEAPLEDAIEPPSGAPVELEAAAEPIFAMADGSPEPAVESRDVEALAEFEAIAVAPPALDAIPIDFMMAQAPAVDFASFDAVSFEHGVASPIELDPPASVQPAGLDPQIDAFSVEAERPAVPIPAEPEPLFVVHPVEIEAPPAVVDFPADPEPALAAPAEVDEPVQPFDAAPAVAGPPLESTDLVAERAEISATGAADPQPPVNESIEPAPVPTRSFQPPVKKRRRTALALG